MSKRCHMSKRCPMDIRQGSSRTSWCNKGTKYDAHNTRPTVGLMFQRPRGNLGKLAPPSSDRVNRMMSRFFIFPFPERTTQHICIDLSNRDSYFIPICLNILKYQNGSTFISFWCYVCRYSTFSRPFWQWAVFFLLLRMTLESVPNTRL